MLTGAVAAAQSLAVTGGYPQSAAACSGALPQLHTPFALHQVCGIPALSHALQMLQCQLPW
jgi:hypothetical protein